MAFTIYRMAIIAALVLKIAYSGTSAKALSPPAPGRAPAPAVSDCFRALVNTSDCLTYVEAGSNLTKPDKGCCPEVAGLVESNPFCLCELLGHPEATGINIDVTKALKLPSVCGVSTTLTVSNCSAVGVPVSLAPSEDSMSPSDQPTRSPSDEDATSSPGNKDNGASSFKASTLPFIFGLVFIFVSILF